MEKNKDCRLQSQLSSITEVVKVKEKEKKKIRYVSKPSSALNSVS